MVMNSFSFASSRYFFYGKKGNNNFDIASVRVEEANSQEVIFFLSK